MEETKKNINLLELHCTGINYPKRISFFYIPYPETYHDLIIRNDELSKQIDHAISQEKCVGELFTNTNFQKAERHQNDNIGVITTQNNHGNHQKSKIPESTVSHLEVNHNSNNNLSVIETTDNESYNEVSGSPKFKHCQERKMGESSFYILNKIPDNEYRTRINPEQPQEQHIGESFIYIAYSKTSHTLKHLNHFQQINVQDSMITTLAEDIYSTVSDSKENFKDDVFSSGDEKVYSILEKKENKTCDTKFRYPAISLYNAHIKTENNSASTNTSSKIFEHFQDREVDFKLFEFSNLSFDRINDSSNDEHHDHSQGRQAPGLNLSIESLNCDNEITEDDEGDYAEPYGNMYNSTGANNQCAYTDEHIYSTISDLTDNSKDTTKYTEGESPSANWIHDTLAMLDSVANLDHVDEVDNDASVEFDEKSQSDAPTPRICDLNSGYNKLSTSCYDLRHTSDQGINQLAKSTCDLRPPPVPPKNGLMHYDKSSSEISDFIERSTYQMYLMNDGVASGMVKMDELMDQVVWENPSYDSQNGSFTQLSSIDEEILQAPIPCGPPPPKPPRLNDRIPCINQSNNPALRNNLRISKSLSHIPNDSYHQNTNLVTATKSVPGGALPLFPSERQQGVEPYQSPYTSPKAESFFNKLKKPKIISTKKNSRSGEDLVIGHPYKFQHLNTGIDYLKNLEKEKCRDSLDYLSHDGGNDSMPEEKSFEISKSNGTNSEEDKIYNHFKYTDDMKNKNLEIYKDTYKTLNKKEISNTKSKVDSNENLSDDAKHEKAKYG